MLPKNLILAAISMAAFAGCGPTVPTKTYEVVVVVKGNSGGWWDRFKAGVASAGTEFKVTASQVGPDGADSDGAKQIALIEGLIARKVDAIGIVPNNVANLEPVLKKAREAGIVVLSHEGSDQKNADWNIEAVDNVEFGTKALTSLATAMGNTGNFGLYVGGGGGHDYWAHIALGVIAKTPSMSGMKLVSLPVGTNATTGDTSARMVAGSAVTGVIATVCGENECGPTKPDCQCRKATEALLLQVPDLKGILGFGSQAPIGAGMALQGLMKKDVKVVGAAVPSQAKDLLVAGYITEAFLWDPANSGYAVVAVAQKILNGDKALDKGVEFARLGKATVTSQDRDIVFNAMQSISKDNAETLATEWGL